jgi:hypothetical protein
MPRSESLIHDHAWALAHALLDLIAHNYREEEQREIFAAFYNGARGALESYDVQQQRIALRITPCKN